MRYVANRTLNIETATAREFVEHILFLRGYMGEKHQDSLAVIHGVQNHRMMEACFKKQMGVRNIEQRCVTLTEAQQNAFCDWMDTKSWKATKNEIDLWDDRNPPPIWDPRR